MANTNNQSQPLLGTAKKTSSSKLKLFSATLLLSLAVIATFSASKFLRNSSQTETALLRSHLCNNAYDKPSCLSHLAEIEPSSASDAEILRDVLARSSSQIREIAAFIAGMNGVRIGALADCMELMVSSMDRVGDSMAALETRHYSDAHSWLSSVLTNHVTCLDGLTGADRPAKESVPESDILVRLQLEPMMKKLISKASSCLAMMATIASSSSSVTVEDRRKKFPAWLSRNDRRLLQVSGQNIVADAVVAADGSGNYTTVQAAVDAAPKNPVSRYVIYVKAGVYVEQVSIAKKKNLMLVGDGMDCTVITGSLNVIDGSTTFRSATVAATGDGFIAQDLCIQNTAGPEKHQAVALRVGADKSVINRCNITAFQDTLYTHSLRQFYRDCYITGTVDFIFGDGTVVIQNSQIVARKPMNGQNNMLTAQGRTDPNSNTGYSIQFCNITASPDLESEPGSVKSYLGRPWKMFSRTVFMESSIGAVVDPAGWSVWTGDFALDTLYYGEYLNSGPGAGIGGRVNWTGFHGNMSRDEAAKFTVAAFIYGGDWLVNTGVTFSEGL